MMNFAFVIHPLDVGLVSVAFKEPNLLHKKNSLVKKAFEWLPSFKCSHITGIKSKQGITVEGDLMYVSLLPEQIITMDEKFVLSRVIDAGKIAQENGAGILGLGAYAAQVGKKGVLIARNLGIPVTTGTHYTIYMAIQSVLVAAHKMDIDVKSSTVAVVGATGGIGRLCTEYFADKCRRLLLVARNMTKLESLTKKIPNAQIQTDVKKAMDEADICVMSTTTPEPLVDVEDLRPGSLVCDISRPRNVSMKNPRRRSDVLVIDGGIVQPPGENVDFNFYFGLQRGLAYACMAETIILAMEGRKENYSIGGDVSLKKVLEIGRLGEKHGFKLARIMSFDSEVSASAFRRLKPTKLTA
ncbi:MAG: shikimate dehydrogenase [Candidatus Omnitrophica bacterium CG07_land_8_20_14_0_80_50_8]|nr:MAG: shikimate dehydrogenase [Candidatus Omnitrophica bacterium CG07_land_8_20_14_0_80_50_8]